MRITMPPLPEFGVIGTDWDLGGDGIRSYGYTADQLRADRLAVAQAVIEACAAIADDMDYSPDGAIGKTIRAIQIEANDADR